VRIPRVKNKIIHTHYSIVKTITCARIQLLIIDMFSFLYLFLFLLSLTSINQVIGQVPSINSIAPSFGSISIITINGNGFGSNVIGVKLDSSIAYHAVISSTQMTANIGAINLSQKTSAVVTVDSNEGQSNPFIYYVIQIPSTGYYTQDNSIMYITGSFGTIPLPARAFLKAQAQTDETNLVTVAFVNDTTLSFPLDIKIAKGQVAIYDGSTNAVAAWMNPNYAPVVSSSSFDVTGFNLIGYVLTDSQVFIDGAACTITSRSESSITCTPAPASLHNRIFTYSVMNAKGLSTYQTYSLWKQLASYMTNRIDGLKLDLTITDFQQGVYPSALIYGLRPGGISIDSVTGNDLTITPPFDSQCGYAYLANFPIRLTNNLLLCPYPRFLSLWKSTEESTGYGILTASGYFMNPNIYDTNEVALQFRVEYGNNAGTLVPCLEVDSVFNSASGTYTVTCKIPELTSTYFYISTLGRLQKTLYSVSPIITSSTPTYFGIPNKVTISGSKFTLFPDLGIDVTIGGGACNNPVQSSDGKQIVCDFDSNVPYTNIIDPLEVKVASQVVVGIGDTKSVFYYTPFPTITSVSSTIFGKPGTVTIIGTDLYQSSTLSVTIGSSPCTNPFASQDSKSITCQFESNVAFTDYDTPLDVYIDIEPSVNVKKAVFYYTKLSPISIISASSTEYGVPGQVIIKGTNFISTNVLVVQIGGSTCTSPLVSQDSTTITCQFQSDVQVADIYSPLDVYVSIGPLIDSTNNVFYYKSCPKGDNGQVCSDHGICSQQYTCNCYIAWKLQDCSIIDYGPIPNIIISNATSTKYGVPSQVTIIGNDFISSVNNTLNVQIGGSICSNPIISESNTKITCQFQSDVQVSDYSKALDVYINIGSIANSTAPVFLYYKPERNCPIGNNGQTCSNNGVCNQQYTCDCNKGWYSLDCSIEDNGGGEIIPDPGVNPNNPSGTIITPSGTMFDIGIVLINEIDNNNNIIQSYNISNLTWNNITKQNNQYSYISTLKQNNNDAMLNVQLNVNNLNELVYYNFAGDVIPILPKSIKYQVQLQNYTFSSSLNTMQFIFKSGIVQQGDECIYDESNNTKTIDGNSIRSIQMTLNGETLIGTFSDRIVLDNRPSYNQVNKLTNEQIIKYNLNQQSLYVSITTTTFKQNVIVDPNFGVLISSKSDPQDYDQCKKNKKFAAWKIGVIVASCVIGIALVVSVTLLVQKRNQVKNFNNKLKKLNNFK